MKANISAVVLDTNAELDCGSSAQNVLPQDSVTCTTIYTVTQEDINEGQYDFNIRYTAVQARTGVLQDQDLASYPVEANPEPELTLADVEVEGNQFSEVGE